MFEVMFLAVVGGIIGWITNLLAIKMIFRPLKPIKIPLINYELVGLIPKRRREIAASIGEVIETELLSTKEILEKIIREEDKVYITKAIKLKIENIVAEKMPPFIPSAFKGMIQDYMDKVIEEELNKVIDDMIENVVIKASSRIKISEMVEEKINEFDLLKLESIIIGIAKKELKHIEILGLILGFIIGLVQGLIVIFI